jgi:hypothetical protein
MNEVEKLIKQADELFEQAEMKVEGTPEQGRRLFLEGISSLLRGFSVANEIETEGGLAELFARCQQLEPEFKTIAGEFDILLNAGGSGVDAEVVTDAANEIWDFVIDLVAVDE